MSDKSGPAFQYPGLTKRELFAALAMQGLLSNPNRWNTIVSEVGKSVGTEACAFADALLAALAPSSAKEDER